MKKLSIPRGTNDILPEDIPLWNNIENIARQTLKLYGYREIRTPIFEETELFARSMGQTSDVVQKQMLTLQSQKQAEVDEAQSAGYALRPEGTAAVVRSYVENDLDKKESLSKLFYIGPMFRGERPQKGRLRQFHQIGVEAIGPGSGSPLLDAEVIALSMHLLRAFGANNARLKINTLGTPENKKALFGLLKDRLAPRLNELCPECQQRYERNVLRVLDCKNPSCKAVVAQLKLGYDWLSEDSKKYFNAVKKALDGLNIVYQEDQTLVRGLDYYTHTVFEIADSSLGSQDAVGAGGRYNNLVAELGGPAIDAVGFALGIERIILATQGRVQVPAEALDVFVIAMDEAYAVEAFRLLNDFRRLGLSADMGFQGGSVKSQMRLANKLGTHYVVIIGEEEVKKKEIALKDMRSGSQENIPVSSINERFKAIKEGR